MFIKLTVGQITKSFLLTDWKSKSLRIGYLGHVPPYAVLKRPSSTILMRIFIFTVSLLSNCDK